MAQSRPFLGRLEPFYGWYKRVSSKLKRRTAYYSRLENKLNENDTRRLF